MKWLRRVWPWREIESLKRSVHFWENYTSMWRDLYFKAAHRIPPPPLPRPRFLDKLRSHGGEPKEARNA